VQTIQDNQGSQDTPIFNDQVIFFCGGASDTLKLRVYDFKDEKPEIMGSADIPVTEFNLGKEEPIDYPILLSQYSDKVIGNLTLQMKFTPIMNQNYKICTQGIDQLPEAKNFWAAQVRAN
jgi:Ca2+-dependent lipid-binding protein